MKVLVAGIGNIFHGDDAFGCEVIRALEPIEFPTEVTVTDFGIRSYDLAYALLDDYDVAVLVDAVPQRETPGTVYLMEPDLQRLDSMESAEVNPHSMNPVAVLQMARSMGELHGKVYVVGCEPAVLEDDNGEFALSEPVRRAVPEAVKTVCLLVAESLSHSQTNPPAGPESN